MPKPRKQRTRPPPPKQVAVPPCMLGLVEAEPSEEASSHEADAGEVEIDDHPLLFLHTRLPRVPVAKR